MLLRDEIPVHTGSTLSSGKFSSQVGNPKIPHLKGEMWGAQIFEDDLIR